MESQRNIASKLVLNNINIIEETSNLDNIQKFDFNNLLIADENFNKGNFNKQNEGNYNSNSKLAKSQGKKFFIYGKSSKQYGISKEKRLFSANKKPQNLTSYDNKFSNKITKTLQQSPNNRYAVTFVNFEKNNFNTNNNTTNTITNTTNQIIQHKDFNYNTTDLITNTNYNHYKSSTQKNNKFSTNPSTCTNYYSKSNTHTNYKSSPFNSSNVNVNSVNLKLSKNQSQCKSTRHTMEQKRIKSQMFNNSIYNKEVENQIKHKSRSRSCSLSNEKDKENANNFNNTCLNNEIYKFSKPEKSHSDSFITVSHVNKG